MEGAFTVDREESLLRGYIPLEKDILGKLENSGKIEEILFAGNGYVTDAVLHLINNKCAKKDILSDLKTVELLGCNLVTDYGVRALSSCLKKATSLVKIDLSGCDRLTDNTYSMMMDLIKSNNKIKCVMKGSSMCYQTGMCHAIDTAGCPTLTVQSTGDNSANCLQSQLLIVPHQDLKTSMGEYLYSGSVEGKNGGFHKSDLKVGDWSMTVTELQPSSFLMDKMISAGHSQVMIPFDASSDPKDVLKHVITTVSTVVSKEPAWSKMDVSLKFIPMRSDRPFMDIHNLCCLEMTEEGSGQYKLRNISTTENVMGVYCSRERFTRSHCYIEVKARKEQAGDGKGGLLLGCLYDVLFSERNPMESTSDVGGMVDGFELDNEEKTVGFGIEGDWLSEYTPGPDARFYFMENGVKTRGKNPDEKLMPTSSMYPLISVISEFITVVDMPPLVQPPQELAAKWLKENRWIEKGFVLDCLVDKTGRMRRCRNYSSSSTRSLFLGRREARMKQPNSFTVVVEELGVHTDAVETDFSIGLAGEGFKTLSTSAKDIIFSLCFTMKKEKWSCDKCKTENKPSDVKCSSCSDEMNPNIIKLASIIEARNAKEAESKEILNFEVIKVGDRFTVDFEVTEEASDTTDVNMTFLHNEKQIWKSSVKFTLKSKSRLVPFVGIAGTRDILTLRNYRPQYRKPAPYRDRITVGRLHYMNITDDGVCEYKNPFPEKNFGEPTYGWFMGKTPFNKDLLEFTVQVMTLDSKKLFGIGVTEPDFMEKNNFIGWKQDQLGYHADNGQYYQNSGSGAVRGKKAENDDGKINSGDTVTVKIAPFEDNVPLKFDEDGDVAPHQKLTIQFYKNGILIYEVEHTFSSEGIYPAFSTKDSTVKIRNFYPETAAIWDEVLGKMADKSKKEKVVEEPKDEFTGTQFLVVGMSQGSSDPAGKLQIVQQQIEQLDQSSWTELVNVKHSITELEKDFGNMDLQDQHRYGHLCGVHDNMVRFLENSKKRLKYMAVDCSDSDKQKLGRDMVLKEVEKMETRLKDFQPLLYRNVDVPLDIEKTLMKALQDSYVLYFKEYLNTITDKQWTGRKFMAFLKLLQFRGKLLLVDIGSDTLIIDITFVILLEQKLGQLLPAEMLKIGTTVTCLGQMSHVWESSALDSKILGDFVDASKPENKKKIAYMRLVLEKCLGLIRVPCLRTKPDDQFAVYVVQKNLDTPPKPLADFCINGKSKQDFVVTRQIYNFPANVPEYVLPLLISNTTKYGRMILLSAVGVLYQNGAVQTVIMKIQDSGKESILVESKCYMPDISELDDSRLSKLTPSNVEDYTWNVFCIYTDIIDDLLQRSNIVVMVTKEFNKNLVNVSVGCKHTWMKNPDLSTVVQSVCTLCEQCCEGEACHYNGIMSEYLRQSGCGSKTTGCRSCGICMSCAQELWSIRSRLRPNGNTILEVKQTIAEKTTKIEPGEENKQKQSARDPLQESIISLDPHIYNEVEFTNLSTLPSLLCLREESDGTILKAFPGAAARVQDLSTVPLTEKIPDLSLQNGDHIKITLSDPLGASLVVSDASKSLEDQLPIEPQYFATGREVKVIHETGIVLYDTASSAIPVGQMIAVKPMTKDNNNFSIRVLATGDKGTIAMGLGPQNYAPNRQPGWNSQSIGYHADDGGIFLEAGYATRKTQMCTVGDIMSFFIDFDKNKGFFRKNGEKMIELNLNFSKLACYPMIGMHSSGEAVEILEKEFWIPTTEQERKNTPPALSTYKYGNLWISPGDKVILTRISSRNLTGWVVLHNPLKDPVGFKVHCVGDDGGMQYFGVIEHKKSWMKSLTIPLDTRIDAVVIEWTSLESGRTYTEEDMKTLFGTTSEQVHQSSHQHRLITQISQSNNTVEELVRVRSGQPKEKNVLCMHLYKNMKLVDEYWLKYGHYQISVEATSKLAKFLLKFPKAPSYTYPKQLQKGMKFVIYLESEKAYAECVVVEVYPGGKSLALEYSPKDRTSNMTICMMTKSPAFQIAAFDENTATILPYQARNTPANLTRTFVTAPPYLLSEGAKKTLNFLHPEWKADILKSVADCSQVFTRITVQEQHIWNAARLLMSWFPEGYDGQLFTYLPSGLTQAKLAYPQPSEMFKDIAVHRLCFPMSELIMAASYPDSTLFEMPMKLALHFVDIPGIHPSPDLHVDTLFGEGLNVWTYVALLSSRLFLPSYSKMIPDEEGKLSRGHIEHLLHNMIHVYASLCGIYAASWGSVQYSPMSDVRVVKKSIKHNDHSLVPVTPEVQLSPHVLTQIGSSAVCKAHKMSYGVSISNQAADLQFKYDYFEPYMEHVTMFYWAHENLEKLPEDFFQKFSQLIHFQLGDSSSMLKKFKTLPEGIGSAENLKIVELTNLAMQTLPNDVFMGKKLKILVCVNLPLKSLPVSWPTDSKLEQLDIGGSLISTFPDDIGKLTELRDLDLCHNPITDLPEGLKNLKKLSVLRLQGCPWLTLEGQRPQITHQQFQAWHDQNPYIKYNLGDEKVEKLFGEYDANHNGSLDEEELAAMNLEQFFKIPRLGIADINDEATGGIPPVIFNLKSLTELHLDYNAITMVPQAINNLQNLKVLNLNHNPLLESLPGSLGHLPNIKKILIQSCAQLRTPPTEVVSRGFESVKAYLKRLAGGFTECRRTKLMVVGLGGAGKTSLLRALMSDKKMTSGTEAEIPTDGIDIVPWTVTTEDGHNITYSTWDFAGQAVYYNTHQFFLSKRAVYLLLWSMRQGYEHAGLDFWLSSICCHAPGTPIIVVGTQCDLIPQAEIPEKELRERYPQIASFHQVSSIKGIGIADLQKSLLDVTLQQGYMGEKIPQVWLNFERRIIAERLTKKSYIKWEVARTYAMEQGIYDEKDVRMAIQLLHDLGTVQYFDNDFLRDYVVINPQWIVNVMACVVSAQDSPIQKNHGRFLHSDIPVVWKEYDEDLHEWLLRLTEDFDLTFPLPKEPVNVVPCLLPGEPPDDLNWPSVRGKQDIRETKMVYRFTYLPSGLFNRAQVRLFQFSDGKKIWKKGSMLSKNNHLALIKQTDNFELVVFVQGPRPENILFLIHEVFESIIEESFNGVSYDLYLPCPDCIMKEGTTEPDLLNSKLIQRAKDLKAPFIQCYKYFHWISMAQLQEKLPANSREVADFDIQLQQSVVALQELNNDLVVDAAILYSMADVPKPGDTESLPPSLIRDDILSWGHTCWFAEDINSVSVVDMTAAIKNCKILLVLVSDEFERDSRCHDMFLYAKETMNKEIIIFVLGQSTEWMNKDLGMKIGRQERMVMAKTRKRYEVEGGRRSELKEWLSEKLLLLKQDIMFPEVFLSYCWSNSLSAAEKSGRLNSDCLGWADPRQMKAVLQEHGINCWIDTEYVGKEKKGIFADMAAGIRNSKVMLAFISDEYAESDNCMMELRFGIINMELPVVAVIVGTKMGWKLTEVAMLLRRAMAHEVNLQKENPEGINVMVKFLKDEMNKIKLSGPKKRDEAKEAKELIKQGQKTRNETKTSSVAYQEEVELIQRKFMRHIIGSILAVDTIPLPRLIVVDFVKAAKQQKADDGRESTLSNTRMPSKSRKLLRPKTATKSRDRLQVDENALNEDDENDWTQESFNIHMLCEHEGGWHLCSQAYPLAFRTRDIMEQFLSKAAPYLYRIYTILKQSPIKLKCFTGTVADAYQKWIREQSEENLDFVGAMMHLRSHLATDEAADFVSCLARCRLPSGKIVWLCEQHQKEEHVAKLSTGSRGSSYNITKVLFNEDKYFLEHMEKSKTYKKLKAIKSNKVAPELPKPVPLPAFVPMAPSPGPHGDDKVKKTTEQTGEADKKPNEGAPMPPPGQLQKSSPGTPPPPPPVLLGQPPKNSEPSPQANAKLEQQTKTEEPQEKIETSSDTKSDNNNQVTITKQTENSNLKADGSGNSIDQLPKQRKDSQTSNKITKTVDSSIPEETENAGDGTGGAEKLEEDNTVKPTTEDEAKRTRRESLSKKEIKEKEKEKIKQMILKSDSKALSKALSRTNMRPVAQSGLNIRTSDMKTSAVKKQNSGNFSNVLRGSNVKRIQTSTIAQTSTEQKGGSRTSTQSSLEDLESTLQINTVQGAYGGSSGVQTSKSGNASPKTKSADSGKADTYPLDRVRPKKIKVQPKTSQESKGGPKSTMTATGIGIGVTKGSEMPLPERTDSKACSLQ